MNEENATSVSEVAPNGALAAYAAMNANLKQVKAVLAENLGPGGINEFDLTRIKVPSGGGVAFELVDPAQGVVVETKFNAIVLAARDTRGYWKTSLDDGGGVPPDCHSSDCVVGIGSPGGACLTCPFAQYGSETKASGERGKGQACKQMKQVFVMREGAGSYLPEILNVPPTSLKVYRQFAMRLSCAIPPAPIYSVVTEIGLTKTKNSGGTPYAQLTFRTVTPLAEGAVAQVRAYADDVIAPMLHTPRAIAQASAATAQANTGDEAF